MEERRENDNLLIATLEKIDKRTENIDKRLREVEQKINNGFTTRIAVTDENVRALIEEQKRLREQSERDRVTRETIEKHKANVYKVIGAVAALSGIIFGVVRLL